MPSCAARCLSVSIPQTEINEDGVTGFMSNVGDVDNMSNHAIELLKNNEELAKFKKNAYAQAEKFDIQNIVPKYEKLYDRFCKCL